MQRSSLSRTLARYATRTLAAVAAITFSISLAACSQSSTSSDTKSEAKQSETLAGITATGKSGEKPTIKLHTPMTVTDGATAVLIKGEGDAIQEGQRICFNGQILSAKDGSISANTWDSGKPECSLVITKDSIKNSPVAKIISEQKLGATVAIGSNDGSGTSYIYALTLMSAKADRAEGEKVSVPEGLPTITLANDGKPSIDIGTMSEATAKTTSLISQDLIKGSGETLTDTNTAIVKYTGWLTDGTQFDSSWDRGDSFDADLSASGQIIEGWKKGLIGHTVGSQVLLVIPPDLGYGNKEAGSIPANSVLIFVVDIVAGY